MIRTSAKPGLEIDSTAGGGCFIRFHDRFGRPCSLQESKLGLLPTIWLGLNDLRMHLDQENVQQLLPLLHHFMETGYLQPLASSIQATQGMAQPSGDGGGISLADVEFMMHGHEAGALHQLLLLLQQTRQDADRQHQLLTRCYALLEKSPVQSVNGEHDDFWQDWREKRDALLKAMTDYDDGR